MAEKLTDARVRSAPARDSRYSIMDAKEPGLELRIYPDGRRVFALRRSVNGRDVRVTIGQYGPAPLWTLEQARAEAAALRARLSKEGDFRSREKAAEAAERERREYTVHELADDWLGYAKHRLRASTLRLHRQRIDTHIRPALGDCEVKAVSRVAVRNLVNAIGEKYPVTANKVAQLLSALYRYARVELERDVTNPAADLKPFREQNRTRVLNDEELKAFWIALDTTDLPPGPQVAIALKLALLTGQRIGEIIGMRDYELNLAERLWIVPGSRTKSGRENRVPLTQPIIALILRAQEFRGAAAGEKRGNVADAPVFASLRDPATSIRRLSVSQGMARLCRAINLAPATPHDLRRTARTLLSRERLDVPFDDAERLMSHVVGSAVSRVYVVNDFLPQKRRALERLGQEVERIVGPRTSCPDVSDHIVAACE